MTNTSQVTHRTDQVERLTSEAKAMGLNLFAYLDFLATVASRKHDATFVDAAKYTFSKYTQAFWKLAQ